MCRLICLCLFAVLGITTPAQAEVIPQFRVGVHAGIPLSEKVSLGAHVIVADILQGGSSFAYVGPSFQLNPEFSLEALVGGTFRTEDPSFILSPRACYNSKRIFLWVDLEYAPLAAHNLYSYLDAKFKLDWFRVGLDSENWISPLSPEDGHLSAGPAIGAQFGEHVNVSLVYFFANDTPQGFPRLNVHLFF